MTYCALWSSNLYTKMGTWIIWLSTSNSGCPPQKSGSLSRSQYLQADSTSSQLKAEGYTHQRIECLESLAVPAGPDKHTRSRQGAAHNNCPSQQAWHCKAPSCEEYLQAICSSAQNRHKRDVGPLAAASTCRKEARQARSTSYHQI